MFTEVYYKKRGYCCKAGAGIASLGF
ncbi:MAG: hypothetical protein R2822_31615 [Spirosomataceae bacterium]